MAKPLPNSMLWPVIFWITGLLLSHHLALGYGSIIVSYVVLLITALFVPKLRIFISIIIFLVFGMHRMQQYEAHTSVLSEVLQKQGHIQHNADFVLEQSLGKYNYEVTLCRIAGYPLQEKLILKDSRELEQGASYSALVEILPLRRDPVLDIFPNRYSGSMRLVGSPTLIDSVDKSLRQKAQNSIRLRLRSALGTYSPLAEALLLSDSGFKREHRQTLSRAGATHLIVVSGLHVVILSFILFAVLRSIFPWRIADLLLVVLLLGFAALNNWSPPILRASLMILLARVAKHLSRPLSLSQNLFVSLFIITLINPGEIFGLSLQFSFLAVALIAFALPKFKESTSQPLRMFQKLGNYMLLSLIVALGLAPLSLFYFGSASLSGIMANLLGLPLVALLLICSILVLIFPTRIFSLSFIFLADLWDMWLKLCASLPLYIEGEWISSLQAFALGLILLLLFLLLRRRYHLLQRLLIPISAAILILIFLPTPTKDKIFFFNSGVSDSIMIFADDGQSFMIDTGGVSGQRAESTLAKEKTGQSWLYRRLLRWMRQRRIKDLDYVMITHLHSDHAGGFLDLFDKVKIHNLILSQNSLKSEIWKHMQSNLDLSEVNVISITDTCSIALGSHRVTILHPDSKFKLDDINEQSIVCRYDAGQKSYLFTGDIEAEAEKYLCDQYPDQLKADVLKVAHHGSGSSTSDEFLSMVRPELAIITSSQKNIYGFPHPRTFKRLRDNSIEIRYTYDGSIRLDTKP
nr:competence protein ComEC [Candidatus Cloacimonadota bacterium]